MNIQIEVTPNPNSLKFIPGKIVSKSGPIEITDKSEVNNELIRNILSINAIKSVFLGKDFLSVNKAPDIDWEEVKHIIISLIEEFYAKNSNYIFDKNFEKKEKENFIEIEQKIIDILESKVRPAVAKDGGDIKFKEFKDGVVKVQLQGSCSGCPSSTMTLKQGVQNLLCHYIPEVREVISV